jgi:hypothetical protein
MSGARGRAMRFLAAALTALFIVSLCVHRISGAPIEKDAAQVTLMAFNLERHGILSMEEAAPLSPTNYREPAPAIFSAAAIALIDATLGEAAAPDAYYQGDRVRLLKYQNILWLGLLSLGAFWAARVLGSSFYLALLAAVLVTYPFWKAHTPLDDLYTDIPAAAFLMLASTALTVAFRRRSPALCALAGVLFGILTLIKAAFLYVFVGTLAVMACVYLLQRDVVPLRLAARELIVLIAAFGCSVAPWIYRNYVELGTLHISQRAGVVLMYRAVDDQMTPEEYRGTFYVYAPERLQGIIGRILGFSPADLQRNGRLQRLNEVDGDFAEEDLAAERAGAPERAIAYYRRARAERVKMEQVFFAAGGPQPEIAADDALKDRAVSMILQRPWMHLALTIPFLWRGATLVFPVLLIALLHAARRRRYDLLVFGLPAFGAVMLYGLFSHFIGRYDLPSLCIATVVLLVSIRLAQGSASRGRAGAVSGAPAAASPTDAAAGGTAAATRP